MTKHNAMIYLKIKDMMHPKNKKIKKTEREMKDELVIVCRRAESATLKNSPDSNQ